LHNPFNGINNKERLIWEESLQDIPFSFCNKSWVNLIEKLQDDKGLENQSVMNTLLGWDKGGSLDIKILWVPFIHRENVSRIHLDFCIHYSKCLSCAFCQSTHFFDSSCSNFIVSSTIATPHPASEFIKCITVIIIFSCI